ncbi:CYTH and CHAD domain-containing protein [Acetobacter conturbans]|nr:CYTH and CHAD domain-containing protein [Acetobacter conturbans]
MSEKNISTPLEIELKLLFPPDARALLDRFLAEKTDATEAVTKHLVTTYHDTPDLLLSRSGLSLRIRHTGHQRIQTLKSQGDGNRLAPRRGEWEWPVKSDHPDLDLLSGTPAEVLRTALNGKLEPVWLSDVRRTTHMLRHDGATVELAIDEGFVRAGEARVSLRELELELKNGPATALYSLALALQEQIPLRFSTLSKAERGYRLLTGTPPAVEPVQIPPLSREMTLVEGFRTLIQAGVNGLIANQPAAEAGDPEAIHQMRVAIRQLRTMLQLFSKYTERRTLDPFQGELQRIGRELGEARDWDVFCLETLPAAFTEENGTDLTRMLRNAAADKRTEAHQHLFRELHGTALTTLLLSLTLWTENHPFREDDTHLTRPASDSASKLLNRMARKAMRRGHGMSHLSEAELHGLRKSLKKLRYSTRYFSAFYPHHAGKTYMKRCKRLQQHLGEINDAAVASTLTDTLIKAHLDLAPAASILTHWNEERHRHALRALPDSWKDFQETEPFWN